MRIVFVPPAPESSGVAAEAGWAATGAAATTAASGAATNVSVAAAQVASLDDSARSAQTISIIGFVVGGVGVATGTVLFFLSGKKDTDSSSTVQGKIQPWIGLGSVGVSGTY